MTPDLIISTLDDQFKNLTVNVRCDIINELINSPDIIYKKDIRLYVKSYLGIDKMISVFTKDYWVKRGWDDDIIDIKISEQRPNSVYYYIKRGFTEDESINEVRKYQSNQGIKYSNKYSKHDMKCKSKRCVEYWMVNGLNEVDAIDQVSKHQSTFSLDICVEKFGKVDGYNKWLVRQNKWKKTLNDKPIDEINYINHMKGCRGYKQLIEKYGSNWKHEYINMCDNHNLMVCHTVSDLNTYINNILNKSIIHIINDYDKIIDMFQPRHFMFLDINMIDYLGKVFRDNKIEIGCDSVCRVVRSGYGYISYTKNGEILRSSNEIYFYKLLNTNINSVGKSYNNSNMKYDFLMNNGDYIEIAGMMNIKEYKDKMLFKSMTFGSIILKNKQEIDRYVDNYRKSI